MSRKPAPHNQDRYEKVLNLWAANLTMATIAERFGVGKRTVAKFVRMGRELGDPRALTPVGRRASVETLEYRANQSKLKNDLYRRKRLAAKFPSTVEELKALVLESTTETQHLKPGFAAGLHRVARGF